jgi:hypothetical protein
MLATKSENQMDIISTIALRNHPSTKKLQLNKRSNSQAHNEYLLTQRMWRKRKGDLNQLQ